MKSASHYIHNNVRESLGLPSFHLHMLTQGSQIVVHASPIGPTVALRRWGGCCWGHCRCKRCCCCMGSSVVGRLGMRGPLPSTPYMKSLHLSTETGPNLVQSPLFLCSTSPYKPCNFYTLILSLKVYQNHKVWFFPSHWATFGCTSLKFKPTSMR